MIEAHRAGYGTECSRLESERLHGMLHISDILIERHDLASFADLVGAVRARAREERFLRIDVKPPFADTPDNWEDVLESAFTSATGR